MELDQEHSPSFRHKLKSSICNSCCFMDHRDGYDDSESGQDSGRPRLIRSASEWIKSGPELKEKCINLFSRISHRRRCTNEFRYDPLSYALNFEDDDARIDEFPLRNFSSRLPPSPPSVALSAPVGTPREITAWS
ncbi:hypothetical protein Ancab_001744 [Ancistrocladus abbreviatus]